MHEENTFITLTFSPEHLPKDKSIRKRHMQDFMRKLRSNYDHPIRFFGCGEYGEKKDRPHYHICLFGHQFDDMEVFKNDVKTKAKTRYKAGHDHTLFTSHQLSKIWTKGFHTIGALTYESAAYVARYVTKKITGTSEQSRKLQADLYGGREKEFALMSRMPGIGTEWFKKYYTDVYPKDFIVHNGKRFKPPRFYDNLYARMDPHKFVEIKEKRRENSDEFKAWETSTRELANIEKKRTDMNKNFQRKDI